jgi:pilus assembly protein CpaB
VKVAQNRGGLFVVLAVVLGLSAALLIFMVLSQARSGRTRGLVPVVVASSDLTYGTKLEQAQLRVVNFPKESVPEGAYSDIDSVVGNTTKIFLAAREPVLKTKLSSEGGGLSMMVSPNMRASSVDVKLSSSVSGFVVPGDRVDVLCTFDRQGGGQMAEAVTRTILQNIQVLAAGPKTEQKEKQDKPSDMQTVTLLVDPKGAEVLAQGMHEGKIHLTLRNPEDSDTLSLAAINTRQILGSAAAPAPAPRVSRPAPVRPAPAKPAPTPVVQAPKPEPYKPSVIRGSKITPQEPTQK